MFRRKIKSVKPYMIKWNLERKSSQVFSLCMQFFLVWLTNCDGLWGLATNLKLFKIHRNFHSTCEDIRVVWTKNTSWWKVSRYDFSIKTKHGGLGWSKCCFESKQHSQRNHAAKPNWPIKTKWGRGWREKRRNRQIRKYTSQ